MKLRVAHRRGIFAVSSLTLLTAVSLYVLAAASTSTPYLSLVANFKPKYHLPNARITPQHWCKHSQCTSGHWERRAQPEDMEDEYPNPDGVSWQWCAPMPLLSGRQRTAEEHDIAGTERSLDVRSWIWVPNFGQLWPWNAEEFVVRLLKSPGGLILIGDSITRQHFQTITRMLTVAEIEFDTSLPHLPMHEHKNVHQHTLRLGSASTKRLVSIAGVPLSRLQRPIVTFLEDHMLIGEAEIRNITAQFGAPADQYPWFHDFQRVEGWEEFVRTAANSREESYVDKSSILVLNAGAHWSRHELNMFPRSSLSLSQSRVSASFAAMTQLIVSRLSPIPSLMIFYRSTSPGHPKCKYHTEPYLNSARARATEADPRQRLFEDVYEESVVQDHDQPQDLEKVKSGRDVWDWDLFETHNDIWKRTVREEQQLFARRRTRERGAQWRYLDIWESALQRPDAHNEPDDCLHWCMPVVLDQWTHLLNHAIVFSDFEQLR